VRFLIDNGRQFPAGGDALRIEALRRLHRIDFRRTGATKPRQAIATIAKSPPRTRRAARIRRSSSPTTR
jgi:hypothetical protein